MSLSRSLDGTPECHQKDNRSVIVTDDPGTPSVTVSVTGSNHSPLKN